ncbi:MAG: DUF6585 family protein [Campylobacteraceae bacterium]
MLSLDEDKQSLEKLKKQRFVNNAKALIAIFLFLLFILPGLFILIREKYTPTDIASFIFASLVFMIPLVSTLNSWKMVDKNIKDIFSGKSKRFSIDKYQFFLNRNYLDETFSDKKLNFKNDNLLGELLDEYKPSFTLPFLLIEIEFILFVVIAFNFLNILAKILIVLLFLILLINDIRTKLEIYEYGIIYKGTFVTKRVFYRDIFSVELTRALFGDKFSSLKISTILCYIKVPTKNSSKANSDKLKDISEMIKFASNRPFLDKK